MEFAVGQPTDNFMLPPSPLQRLHFPEGFNRPIDGNFLPDTLKAVTFGKAFNQPIAGVVWPSSVERLSLGGTGRLQEPISSIAWPSSLTHLICGEHFDQKDFPAWPGSLQEMPFEHYFRLYFNTSLASVSWPASLRQLTIYGMDHTLGQRTDVRMLPPSLDTLDFPDRFDEPLDRVPWTQGGLEEVKFGSSFNQPINGVGWPPKVTTITFGRAYDQPIDGVLWPPTVRTIIFGHDFDQRIDRVSWTNVEKLVFGDSFNQPIDRVPWCEYETSRKRKCQEDDVTCMGMDLTIGNGFSCQSGFSIEWPMLMKRVTIGGRLFRDDHTNLICCCRCMLSSH